MSQTRFKSKGIISLIKLQGYKSDNKDGICLGLALAFRQAILSDPALLPVLTENGNEDVMIWESLTPPPISHIDHFKKRLANLNALSESDITHQNLPLLLNTDEKAFLETVEIFQNSEAYREIFTPEKPLSQLNGLKRLPAFLKPNIMGENNITSPYVLCGIYSRKELKKYFDVAFSIFSEQAQYPIVLTFLSRTHAMNVVYLPNSKTCLLSNNVAITETPLSSIAREVFKAFNKKNNLALSSYFSIHDSQQENMKSIVTMLKQNETWCKIHEITPDKAAMKTEPSDTTLLDIVIEVDQEKLMTETLNARFPSKKTLEECIKGCIKYGYKESLLAILAHPECLQPHPKHLEMAIEKKNYEAFALLCSYKSNIHYKNSILLTHLSDLAQTNKTEVAKLFQKKNNLKPHNYISNFSLLHRAVLCNCDKIVKLLLNSGINLYDKACGVTALDLAQTLGNKKIITLLKNREKHYSATHSFFLRKKTPNNNTHIQAVKLKTERSNHR